MGFLHVIKVSNVAATISLTSVNFEKLMFSSHHLKKVLNLPGISVNWIFFGIFYNIIENILKLFFPNGTCGHFFVDEKLSY